jgi:hypothetical protein
MMSCLRISVVGVFIAVLLVSSVKGQPPQCDPTKVNSAEKCAKCHSNEVQTWKQTPHFQTFEQLSRSPEAKEICNKLGLRSVKRSDVCIDCHFTTQEIDGRIKAIAGISCESCHGASVDWIAVHNDYGGPMATKEDETPDHRAARLDQCTSLGMRNTRDLYLIASSCYQCHTVPNEKLVNVGGHNAGSEDFELVRWSQGMVRHNYLRTNGEYNAQSTSGRLRVMYVVGLIADLEYSARATANATEKSTYGLKVANRAAKAAVKLFEVQQKIDNPFVQAALEAFAGAELKVNNKAPLLAIADQIQIAGRQFAMSSDGSELAVLDEMLPDPNTYK